MSNTVVSSFRCSDVVLTQFQNKYFGLTSKYIEQALKFALQSQDNFNTVFFGTPLKTVKETKNV